MLGVAKSCLIACSFFFGANVVNNAFAESLEKLEPHIKKQSPAGVGPFPVMILLPGCSGFDDDRFTSHYDSVQAELTKKGYATYRLDVLAARNAASCSGVTSESASPDVKIFVDSLRNDSSVKEDDVSLIGWSWGAKIALQSIVSSEKPNVKSIISYYPNCDWLSTWTTQANVLLFFGDKDTIADPTGCQPIFDASEHGPKSKFQVFDGALHLFDFANLKQPIQDKSHAMGYDNEAANAAWVTVEGLLGK